MRHIFVLSLCLLFAVIGACKKNATQSPANTSSGTAETSTTSASPAQAGSPSADQAATAVKPKGRRVCHVEQQGNPNSPGRSC